MTRRLFAGLSGDRENSGRQFFIPAVSVHSVSFIQKALLIFNICCFAETCFASRQKRI
jgi:hypothetical protein